MSISSRVRAAVADRCATWKIPWYTSPVAPVGALELYQRTILSTGFSDAFIVEFLAALALFHILETAPVAVHLTPDWLESIPEQEGGATLTSSSRCTCCSQDKAATGRGSAPGTLTPRDDRQIWPLSTHSSTRGDINGSRF